MNILTKNNSIKTNFFYLLILILFSFFINYYYAKLGSFPIDTFLHYDSAYRILNGELPIKDYWIASGLIVDILQSFFFKIFGVNWFAYILHASLFNCLITILIYFFFLKNKINNFKAFLLSISFSILSYTISGTPFVDLHATYFLLIATLLIINNLNTNKNYLWFIITFSLFLSFLSKQVPAAYGVIFYFFILTVYFINKKEFKIIKIIIISLSLLLALIFLFLKLYEIDFINFIIQYLDYPRSIGESRFDNFKFFFNLFFNKYKFIMAPIIILTFIKLYKIKIKKMKIFSEEFTSYIIFLTFVLILIFHQLMTKNQMYIYFLIPILFGYLEIEMNNSSFKIKKLISILLITIMVFITVKYHLRFNENRKFHELTKLQLEDTADANIIHSSLSGLKWKNPHFKGTAADEVILLNKIQKELNSLGNKEVMLVSHYKFLDSITNKKMNFPNRTFTTDGVSMPLKKNKYFNFYKDFLINKIKRQQISEILFLKHEKLPFEIITNYIEEECYIKKNNHFFYILELKCFN
jgi:hypothetical protein